MSEAGLSITGCLTQISSRLTDAAAIARAAVECADSGSEGEALRIAMDLDELLNEASTLHGAVCLSADAEDRDQLSSAQIDVVCPARP